MKKALPIAVAAAAMAVAAPASAAVVVVDSSTFDNTTLAPVSGDTDDAPVVGIAYSTNPAAVSINEQLVFTLDDLVNAEFDFSFSPSSSLSFTTFSLTGPGLGAGLDLLPLTGAMPNMNVGLGAGTYTLTLIGSNGFTSAGGNYNGNITFTAVPEPATWMMLLLGFFGAGLMLRRKESFNSDQTMRVTYS